MPIKTQDAIIWALKQTVTNEFGITHAILKDNPQSIVDKVREYFNTNKIAYTNFSYDDLKPYL